MSIDIFCNSEAKAFNRELILDYIKKNYCLNSRGIKNFKVLCLPGHELIEVKEIYDKLGLPRSNIYAVTNDKAEFEKIKSCRGINPLYFDVINFSDDSNFKVFINRARSKGLNFNFIYFDFYTFVSIELLFKTALWSGLLKNGGSIGFTFLNCRERDINIRTAAAIADLTVLRQRPTGLAKLVLYAHVFLKYAITNLANINDLKIASDLLKNEKVPDFNKGGGWTEQVFNNGFYPTDGFLSEYVTDKGTPMATAIFKLSKAKKFGRVNFSKKLDDAIKRQTLRDPFIIRKKKLTKAEILKKKDNKKMSKPLVINYLKEFPNELKDIAKFSGYSINQLRAFKAHLTMGTYAESRTN